MLFVVLLGGKHARAKIEVHDIVFARGDTLTDTYPQLRQQWFGAPEQLHIDGWMAVNGIDGYRIALHPQPAPDGAARLFFINLGGYLNHEFGEAHRYELVVATTAAEAKQIAKRRVPDAWVKPHTDALMNVDDCIAIDLADGQHVHLVAGDHSPLTWQNDYIELT